jgi:hypothetical protein
MSEDEASSLLVAFTLGVRCAKAALNCRDDVVAESLKLLTEVAAGRQTMLDSPGGMTDEDAAADATDAVAQLLRKSGSLRTERMIARKIIGLDSDESDSGSAAPKE